MIRVDTFDLKDNTWIVDLNFGDHKSITHCLPILVLDESGSMQGSINSMQTGAAALMTAYLSNNCPQINVIRYHGSATTFTFHTHEEIAHLQLRCGGMTNFSAAIEEILKSLETAKASNCQARIYFMTDGYNTVDNSKLPGALVDLQSALNKCSPPPTLDVIGFTKNHDVHLLNKLSEMTEEGTFQYADDDSSLGQIMADLLNVSNNKRTVDICWNDQQQRVTAIKNDSGQFQVTLQTTVPPVSEARVAIAGRDPVYVPMISKQLDQDILHKIQVSTIRDTLRDLSRRVLCLETDDDRREFDSKMNGIDKTIDSILGNKDIFRDMGREQRRVARQLHLEFKDIISQLYKTRSQHCSTSELATLLSSASSHVTKTGLHKKLTQRVLSNMNNCDPELAREKGLTLNFSQKSSDGGECILTLDNYQELAKKGDCLCITLCVSRNQAAIADPSQVRIYKIQPTMISLDAFRDAVDMKLLDSTDTNVHGGFEHSLGKTASVLNGMARENINAVLPIYFDEPSWSITRLRLKEALSWMATATWNGWTFSQMEILPLTILVHAIKDNIDRPSELQRLTLDRLIRTCKEISTFTVDKKTLAERQQQLLHNFYAHASYRTIDQTPSLPALVGIAVIHNPEVYADPMFFKYVWEEYFRRELRTQQRNLSETEKWRSVAERLRIELPKYTCAVGDDNEYMDWTLAEDVRPGAIQEAQQTFLQLEGWFESHPQMVSDRVFLLVTIQNILQSTNSDRRDAIACDKYVDPFSLTDNQLTDTLQRFGNLAIEHFRAIEVANFTVEHNNKIAALFAATDMKRAEKLITQYIPHRGATTMHIFARALFKPSAHPIEKLKMLTTGLNANGQRLINVGWNPNRRWYHKWWMANVQHSLDEDIKTSWIDFAPFTTQYLSYWSKMT